MTPSPETLLTQSNEYLTIVEPLVTREYLAPDDLTSAIEEVQGYYDTMESSVQTTQGLLTDIEQNVVKAESYKAAIDGWLLENGLTSTLTRTLRRPYTSLLIGQNDLVQRQATTQIQLASLEANKETMAVLNSQILSIQIRVCFPGNTPVSTDQGEININKLIAGKHTIDGKKIKYITKVTSPDSTLTCIRRNAIDEGVPSRKTVMTNDHPVEFHGEMVQAGELVDMVEGAFKIRYNGEPVYNVVMENKDTMMVNGLRCETVDPRSKAFISMMLMERVSKEEDPAKRVKLGMAMRKVLKKMKLEDIRILSERRMRQLRAQKLN